MSNIIGIAGRKFHGKDTFSQAVVKASQGAYALTHFADELKDQAIQIFGITSRQAYDPVEKEVPFDRPIIMDEYLGRMIEVTGLEICAANFTAYSPRELLQYYGTEYVREAQDDYWVRTTLDQKWGNVLISDTRFPNEAIAIRDAGGKIIKVVRVDMPTSEDGHASETSIDLIEPDITLYTRTGDFSRVNRMAKAVASGDWDSVESLAIIFRASEIMREAVEGEERDEVILADAARFLEFFD